jgi:hypothetical protein
MGGGWFGCRLCVRLGRFRDLHQLCQIIEYRVGSRFNCGRVTAGTLIQFILHLIPLANVNDGLKDLRYMKRSEESCGS